LKHLTIEHFIDHNTKLIAVPLNGSDKKCTLNEEDFRSLMEMGVSPIWAYSQEQVLVRNKRRSLSVARLMIDADAGQHVRFRNGLSWDLRRSNLVIAPGSSKFRTRSLFQAEYPQRQWTLTHEPREAVPA
jgi:hypothetical protein